MKRALPLAALAAFSIVAAGTHAANTEPLDLDPRLLARMANMKAKQSGGGQQRPGSAIGSQDQLNGGQACGAVDIGNVDTGGRARAPREVTVIVTGDVVNNANCR